LNEIIEFLNSKNIEYKLSGKEAVATCPNCNKKDKFYINIETGVFICHRCSIIEPENIFAKGHISKLKEYFGDIVSITPAIIPDKEKKPDPNYTDLVDRYHYNIWQEGHALKYLYNRGIDDEAIKRFKLGFVRKDNQNWISIPSFEDGVPKLIKYRKCPPEENTELENYTREFGGKSVLFNGDCIDKFDEIIITEGEFKTISMILNGYENTVGMTAGAGSLLSDWYDKLVLKDKIYLILDNEISNVGQKAARDVWATRLGRDKCWNVILPLPSGMNKIGVDDFIKANSKEALDDLIKKATRFKVDGILSVQEALYELGSKSDSLMEVFPTPWNSVNKLMNGGLRKGHLTVVGGIPGSGKTSLCLNICRHFSKEYTIPSLLFCLEMTPSELSFKLIQDEFDLISNEINYKDAFHYSDILGKYPMYFGYSSKITMEVFYNTCREIYKRYGIQLVVFDNLQLLIRTGEESDLADASAQFKNIAMELGIFMILVSQPRKINAERSITYDDLKGSAAIAASADEILLINRKRLVSIDDGAFDPIGKIIMDKTRWASGGKCQLHFDGARSKWKEVENK
jgi:KaiC/GvpD/RAD55 family RecA-like ATPase